jgi:flagellar protein FlgJ
MMNITSAHMADLLGKTQAEKVRNSGENGELRQACADFESVLLNYMFQSMKNTVGDGGLFGESFQRNMYESLYIEKMSAKIAEERDLGLGAALFRQLTAGMETETGESEGPSSE